MSILLAGRACARAASLVVASYLLNGCALYNVYQDKLVAFASSERQPRTQAQAASTHLAVVAAARWDDYVRVIQPVFPLTPQDAFAQAIPTTASFQTKLLDATRASLAAGLPQTGVTGSSTQSTDAAGVTREVAERTERTAPGVAPPSPPFLANVPGAGNLQSLPGSLEDDPFLRYGVASDLYQEVNMLNRALLDAEIRDGYEPYLLRLKVAAIPYRRELSRDAYSDLSFFMRKGDDPRPSGVTGIPVVVPLLVTDNLETASNAVTAQFIAEFAAALSGSVQNIGVDGRLQSLGDRLNSALANDRNALRTVARLGENAIRVRLGATLQAGPTGRKAYELLPRTHTVSLLLLVLRGEMETNKSPALGIVSRTVLKEADDGDEIDLSSTAIFQNKLKKIADEYKINELTEKGGSRCPSHSGKTLVPGGNWNWVNRMRFDYVIYGDYKGYSEQARCLFTHGLLPTLADADAELVKRDPGISIAAVHRDIEELWSTLMTLSGDYAVNAQRVDLPPVPPTVLPERGLTVLLQDDRKGATVASLRGGRGLQAKGLTAELEQVGGGHRLAAKAATLDAESVRLTFPSLQQLGLAAKGKTSHKWQVVLSHPVARTDKGKLDVCGAADLVKDVCRQTYGPVLYLAGDNRDAARADLKANIAADRLVAKAGEGSVAVGVQLDPGVPERAAYVEVAGAELASASGGELDALGRLKLPASGRVTLSLRNAALGSKVTVEVGLLGPNGAKEGKPITVKVLDVVADPVQEASAAK